MNKCVKFTFSDNEKMTSTSYLAMLKRLFNGFNFEETESLKNQINNYLDEQIIDEYDSQVVEFKTGETDWLEVLGVLTDKLDDLMLDIFDTVNAVQLSMPLDKENTNQYYKED